jgi:hypothetical protein
MDVGAYLWLIEKRCHDRLLGVQKRIDDLTSRPATPGAGVANTPKKNWRTASALSAARRASSRSARATIKP